jgi:predicted RNase H-like HicB family nuclease
MSREFTAVIQKTDEWWIGWIKEVRGVNAQERTRDELLESLRYALRDILELNAADAMESVTHEYEEVEIAV